jgi:hypothetical protein
VWHLEGISSLLALRDIKNIEFGVIEGSGEEVCLQASDQDAQVVARELRKRRGEPSGIRFVDGRWLDM